MFLESLCLIILLEIVGCVENWETHNNTPDIRRAAPASRGLCAEVLPNNSIHVFWHDPPKISTKLYLVQLWETKSNSNGLERKVLATNFTGLLFENLKAFTNYSIKIRANQKNDWITLASVTNHTFPEKPDAPSFKTSTADTMVITTPKDGLNFSYTAKVFTKNSHLNELDVACNAATNACTFEDLQPNTGYHFTLERCSRTHPFLCSQKSNRSVIFYTKPKEPQNLVLTNATSSSITATWMPPEPNAQNTTKYTVTVIDAVAHNRSETVPSSSNQYTFASLQPTTFYTIRVIACARDNDCGLPAEATAWTLPEEPQNLVLTNATSSSITATWMPPEPNAQNITKYTVTVIDAVAHNRSETVPSSSNQYTFASLQPTTFYTIRVIACARDNDCGLPAEATAWTLPEEPTDLRVYARGQRQLSCEWKGPRKRNRVDEYQVTLYDGDGGTLVERMEINADQLYTTFANLYQHKNYLVNLRACFEAAETGRKVCSHGISVSATTNPDPLPLSIKNHTASSIVVNFVPNEEDREHFNYTLRLQSGSGKVECDDVRGQCKVTDLPANSRIEAYLVVCCKHNLCSLQSKQVAFTKPLQPQNLLITDINSSNISAYWKPPDANTESISKYVVTIVRAMGRPRTQIVERFYNKYTFTRLRPTTFYSVSVVACARNDDCGRPAEATAWTLSEEPTDLRVYARGQRQLSCEWKGPRKRNRVDEYQVTLYDGDGGTLVERMEINADQLYTTFANLYQHKNYLVNLRACFEAAETGRKVCSHGISVSATTNPDPLRLNSTERTASSIIFHFIPYEGDRAHFNYTLTMQSGRGTVECDAMTDRCEVTKLPANSKVEVAFAACCSHRLCSLQSKYVDFTKPVAPLDLQIGSPTNTTIYASWARPQPTGEKITGYRAVAVDILGKVNSCTPSELSGARLGCTFKGLSSCMRYNISVRTCARKDDCSVETTGIEYTLPATVSGFRMEQTTSTNMSFTWTPQSMEACELENITVVIQALETSSIISRCSVKQVEVDNGCTVTGLEPNTAYIAYAFACSTTTHNCAKTSDVGVETLPGVPLQINVSEVSAHSIVLKWSQPSGRQDGLKGFLVRVYERLEDGQRAHEDPISNCTTAVVDMVDDENVCRLINLQPSTNYSVTVTAFKGHLQDNIIFGDESEAFIFTTGQPFPILAVTIGFLFLILIGLPFVGFLFRHQLRELTVRKHEKDNTCDMSQPDWWKLEQIPSGSFTIEYYQPLSLQYLSHIPAPVALEQIDACIESLDSNKQFIPHFLLLKEIAVMGVEKEFHLTKNAGLQCRELNRYIDMLPYDQSIVILGRQWPRILDDPEPKITTTELLNNYINASYIRRPLFGPKGEAIPCDPSDPPNYIATQGPMTTTAADFLTMVYEHRSKLIIMLCRCEEDGKQKCKEYWSDECEVMVTSTTRSVNVITSNVKTLDCGLIRRTLCIIPSNKTEPWYATQFHYTQWPDCEAADMTTFYKLINFLLKFIRKNPVNRNCGPPIVHCSAGVGRSGTLIAASYLLERLRIRPEKIDIFGTTLAIRRWRPNMVQTWVQLKFLYQFIQYCIEREFSTPTSKTKDSESPPPFTSHQNGFQTGSFSSPPVSDLLTPKPMP
ncbi:Receptor-type tyrosine-protein phosphatase delta [Taenia crassiceps]|uniref:Receptor-type tyrosine-protein phosphatase delta n=1 Tax=Taenia crassiceps TaxID=6207 RepID=A0ABR4QLC6_9CEST